MIPALGSDFVAGRKVPKGQWILIGIYTMHRNPKIWKDADCFVPERWIEGSPENKDLPVQAYIPFGDGPRACVGGKFALQEAKHTLLLMFQKIYLELAPCQSRVQILSPRSHEQDPVAALSLKAVMNQRE